MSYLWDTDTCIYFLNGSSDVRDRLKRVGEDAICTTIYNIAEHKY